MLLVCDEFMSQPPQCYNHLQWKLFLVGGFQKSYDKTDYGSKNPPPPSHTVGLNKMFNLLIMFLWICFLLTTRTKCDGSFMLINSYFLCVHYWRYLLWPPSMFYIFLYTLHTVTQLTMGCIFYAARHAPHLSTIYNNSPADSMRKSFLNYD